MEDLNYLKSEIKKSVLKIENKDWVTVEIVFQFPPFINKGYNTLPSFWTMDGKRLRVFPDLGEIEDSLLEFIIKANTAQKCNQITFGMSKEKPEEASIEASFNQKIVEKFEANLPKSQQGKTKAWYDSSNF